MLTNRPIAEARGAHGQSSVRAGAPAWWLHLLTATLFFVHVNYVRFHLFSEAHLNNFAETHAEGLAHPDAHTDGDDHDTDHHKPHSELDHTLQMVGKHQDSQLAIDFVALLPSFDFSFPPTPLVVRSHDENWILPGASPPSPLQPRAPPLV